MNQARLKGLFVLILGIGVAIWQIASFTSTGSFYVYWLFFVIPIPFILVAALMIIGGIMALVRGTLDDPAESEGY